MIPVIIIALYVVGALLVGRAVALRRMRNGDWGGMVHNYGRIYGSTSTRTTGPGEDDYLACGFGALIWPLTLMAFWWTRPPKQKRLESMKAEIDKLEKELGI